VTTVDSLTIMLAMWLILSGVSPMILLDEKSSKGHFFIY